MNDQRLVKSVSMSGLLLTPIAATAGAVGLWGMGAEQGWAQKFFITHGLLSHYELWLLVAVALQASAFSVRRWVVSRDRRPAL
jgi:hypothetical protein